MSALLYAVFTLLIATVDSVFRDAPAYTVTNIVLRIAVLLPLLFSIVGGASRYTRALRRTLWWVMVADVLLPLYFPAGMIVFLFVHVLNAHNFYQHVELKRERWRSVALPGLLVGALGVWLYLVFLFPTMENIFRVLVGLYLIPIALAWSLSITSALQSRAPWAVMATAGMSLFCFTDFQVAMEFLTDTKFPYYGVVNALTYYSGLLCLSLASRMTPDEGAPAA
jgi:YhhN family